MTQIQGRALSYNNLADTDAALDCVRGVRREPACVIVKHGNPCGAAVATDISAAYGRAFATDPTSAFGGIIAFNRTLDAPTLNDDHWTGSSRRWWWRPGWRQRCGGGCPGQEEPAATGGGGPPADGRVNSISNVSAAECWCRMPIRCASTKGAMETVTETRSDGAADVRPPVCLAGGVVCEIECHRVRA